MACRVLSKESDPRHSASSSATNAGAGLADGKSPLRSRLPCPWLLTPVGPVRKTLPSGSADDGANTTL
jgi:hypothetical protein